MIVLEPVPNHNKNAQVLGSKVKTSGAMLHSSISPLQVTAQYEKTTQNARAAQQVETEQPVRKAQHDISYHIYSTKTHRYIIRVVTPEIFHLLPRNTFVMNNK